MVGTYHPGKIDMYYMSQVGTRCDVISKKGIMHYSFLAVKYHVGRLAVHCLAQEAFSYEVVSSVDWAETHGFYQNGNLCQEDGESFLLNRGLLRTTSRNNQALFVGPSV